ncbi:MAG TPA: heme o synthase [Propionibacteriaceae bacterium]|nr:heme o synthase [Propionibacteriaceae bacterium]
MTAPVGTATVPHVGPAVTTRDVIAAYVGLTKPRIVELLLVTTLPAMFLAAHGVPSWRLMLATMAGGYLAAGSANTYNNVIDADIDELMRRTRTRALPRHRVSRQAAALFGTVLGVASVLVLGLAVNWLSAWLALLANALYVFVYTMWLKRWTSQNIIWGGIAGCFPPLIGWTAVTGSVAWPPVILFLIVFFWTPPHTWALAWRYRQDYEAGGVPMLPVVASRPTVARRILQYSVLTVLTSLALWPVARTGWLYPVVAGACGAWLIVEAVMLLRRANAGADDTGARPMRLFHWSNTYLALVFAAAALDPWLLGR